MCLHRGRNEQPNIIVEVETLGTHHATGLLSSGSIVPWCGIGLFIARIGAAVQALRIA